MYPSIEEKSVWDSQYRRWLDFDEREHVQFIHELDKLQDYLDGVQAPPGTTEYTKETHAVNNDPNQPPVDTYYVVINQVIQSHEHTLGAFSKAKISASITARGMKDKGRELYLQRAMKSIEDRNNSFVRVIFPAVDDMLPGGVGWARVMPDAYTSPPNGWINETYIDPRDVMIDANSKNKFYEDTRRRWYIMTYSLEEAKVEFDDIEGFDVESFQPDSEEDQRRSGRTFDKDRHPVTVYLCEETRRETVYKKLEKNDIVIITKEQYDEAKAAGEKNCIKDKEDVWYWVYYNRTCGVFWRERSPVQTWTLIPCINRRSAKRVYPLGDFHRYKNLQDLFNVLVSIILSDANQGRSWFMGVDPSSYQMYAEKIAAVLKEGQGVIPVSQANILKAPGVGEEVIFLLNFVKQSIDNLQSMTSAARGELPAKQIATETVQALVASSQVSHGRKDVMINYFVTQLAKARMMMMAAMWTEEDFIRITDNEPGMPEYIPINKVIYGRDAYLQFLGSLVGLEIEDKVPDNLAQQFDAFRRKFESDNDVQIVKKEFHQYTNDDDRMRTDEEVEKDVAESGLDEEGFVALHGVRPVTVEIFTINKLSANPDVDVAYTMDFEVDATKARRQAIAFEFGKVGWNAPVDVMKDMGYSDAQARYDRAQANNQTVQLAKQIQESPDFQRAVTIAQQIVDDPKLYEAFKVTASAMIQQGAGQGAPAQQ